ncbi:MAG: universal stress protein [Cyanobacteria bacterium SZAS TMP-1]|nr:universal stress protein [Cyanobacteria bacterium SZAS TMP-1]
MKVLLAIEESEFSSAAVDAVADRSWPTATEFRIITVVESLATQYCFAGATSASSINTVLEVERQIVEHHQKLVVDKVAQLAKLFGEGRVTGEVLEGPIADVIIEEAKKWQADLLVVGSHGRKGLQRFLLGSVAGKLAAQAPCSIEIVRAKQSQTEAAPKKKQEAMIMEAHH